MPSTKTLRVTLADIIGPTGTPNSTATVHARYVTANGRGRDVHLTDGTIVVPVRRSVTPGTGPERFDFTVIPSDDADVREADRGFLTEVSWTVTAPEGGKSHGVKRILVPSTADAVVQLGLLSTPIAMPTVSATVIDGGNASAAGYVIRPRRDTTLGWAATNPVLALGEIGFDTDTGEVRVGNGVNQWSDLPDGMVNAYSIAVANGFVGDEAAWLASLVGPVGPVSTTPGPQGPPGPPNALTPGTATTGAAGTSASFTITGTAPSQVLNLTIPRGTKGDPGDSQLLEPGPNRFNAATVTLEFRVDHTTGALTAAAGWWASDFVPVSASSPYWTKVSWYRAYYDNTKTFISGVNVGSFIAGTTFTTPAGAAYVRDSHFEQSRIATQVVAEGSTSRPWTAYQQQVPPEVLREVTPSVLITDAATGATLGDALASLAVVAGPPANAFNPATVTDGFYFNTTTGVMTAGADWHTSDFIPVTAGTVYAGNLVWWIAWFTRDQVFISGSNLTPQGAKTFTAPAGAVYARFSWFGATVPSTIVFRAGASAVLPPIPYTAASVDASLLRHTATLNLPATIPALVGVETNLYFDGIVSGDYALYDVDINCSIGTQQADRWTVTPAAAGTYPVTIDVYRDGVGVARAITSLVVKAAAVGTGVTKSVVVIGDSLIDNATSPPTVLPTLFGAGDPMDITMLGTRGTGPGLHEGRAGWSTTTYTTLSTSGGITNAFWNGSAFSFPAWKTAQGYATVDYAIINLGINDIFAATTDASAATSITTALAQLGTMVTSITGTGTKVGICVTTPPARSQDAFGASYGSGQTRWRYRRNLAAWNAALIATFGGRTAEGIYLLPTNAALDTANNFPTTTAAVNSRNATTSSRQNNGVHPASSGSAQLADVMHHWIKGFES